MTQNRVYNFSAGPAVLPEEVLKTAQDEMMNYQNSGMSVMEMSHRSKTYDNIIKTAEKYISKTIYKTFSKKEIEDSLKIDLKNPQTKDLERKI